MTWKMKCLTKLNRMKKSILIEHSECLTSEDTAASVGASNDRNPANYKLIDLNIEPVSEQFHEYIYFPSSDIYLIL